VDIFRLISKIQETEKKRFSSAAEQFLVAMHEGKWFTNRIMTGIFDP
jgi:hypothetical protein